MKNSQPRKRRGTVGLLEKLLTHVPVEIVLYESKIFRYLESRDLLHLTRTSKDLRSTLMNKSSESVWRIARANVTGGLPPLPSDLNEPQYAHLMFDSYCHVCNKHWHCVNFLWRFRIRCCRTCEQTFPLYNWAYLRNTLRPFNSLEILPKEKVKGKSKGQYDIIYNPPVALRLKVEFMSLQSEEERRIWMDRKRKEFRDLQEDAIASISLTPVLVVVNVSSRILDRLDAIGLRREAELILRGKSDLKTANEFYNHRLVNQPRKLTDRGKAIVISFDLSSPSFDLLIIYQVWVNIEPELVGMLSDHQTERLKRERIQKFQERYAHLKEEYLNILSRQDLREPYPSVGDILTDSVFEETICNSATEEAITPEILKAMLTKELPRILNEWRPAKLRTLLRILQRTRPSATHSDFHLATTIFGCAICDSLLVYPQMFYHQCCFTNRAGHRAKDLDEFFETVEQGPWSACSIFFHSQSSQLAEKIVIGVGLDPIKSTTCDLTLARPVIECSTRDALRSKNFMTWPAALTHNLTVKDEVLFAINCFGHETSKIRAQEPLSHFPDICCAHCHEETIPRELPHHLTYVHDIESFSASSSGAAIEFYKQFQRHWAKNLGAGSTTEIALSRPLHLTNISISSEFRNAFAPTSLMISVVFGEQTSPFYTIATLIVGESSTLQVNIRLDQGVKYVFKVNGPNLLSVLGYHPQGVEGGSASAFRTFARPGFTNRNTGATRGPYARTNSGSNVAPDIVISSAGRSDSLATGAAQPGRTLPAPSTGSKDSNPQNEQASTAVSPSDRQPAQFNNIIRPAPQSDFLSAANARGSPVEFSSGHAHLTIQTPHRIPLHHGYNSQPDASSTSVDHATKKVKGEDGTARKQSLPEGSGNGGGISEVTGGPGNNKRKLDFNRDSMDSSSANNRLVPSATYSRMYTPQPPVAGSSSNHAPPATYMSMHTFTHGATHSQSNAPITFQGPSAPSAAADGPHSSM
ncbi:hypothetical protein F5879DRAFT_1066131 [Lentinula edodes]|nr:hypothetical protein F5879DRAFT_1066131 [Lentinula edodes]